MYKFSIKTKNTSVIPLEKKDFDDIQKVINDCFGTSDFIIDNEFQSIIDDSRKRLSLTDGTNANILFNTIWLIILNSQKRLVGYFYFTGVPSHNKMVEFKFRAFNEYRNKGYEVEVIDMMTRWALVQKDVIMSLYVLQKNLDYERNILIKSGYRFWDEHAITQGFEVYCYEKENKKYLKIFVLLSIALGMFLGLIIHKSAFKIGLVFLIFGFILGTIIDGTLYKKNYSYLINELNEAKEKYGEDNIPKDRIEYRKILKDAEKKTLNNVKKNDKVGMIIKIVIIIVFIVLALYFNYKNVSIR